MNTENGSRWLRLAAVWILFAALLFQSAVPLFASDASISAASDGKDAVESAEENVSSTTKEEAVQAIRNFVDKSIFGDNETANIMLIGVDRRDRSWNGNSDSMMLASINQKTKKIHLMSFMRDMAADIKGHGTQKLNAAYAFGGPTLLGSTLEDNFGVRVDHYLSVDFYSMADIIDQLGGVSITVSDAEAKAANALIKSMAEGEGVTSYKTYDHGAGTYDADGLMTVAYARIRYIGNADYQRTQRQRNVMEEIFSKVKSMGAEELTGFLKKISGDVLNDFTASELLAFSSSLPEILTYQMDEARVPFDGMYSSSGEMLVPNQPDTNNKIAETLAS